MVTENTIPENIAVPCLAVPRQKAERSLKGRIGWLTRRLGQEGYKVKTAENGDLGDSRLLSIVILLRSYGDPSCLLVATSASLGLATLGVLRPFKTIVTEIRRASPKSTESPTISRVRTRHSLVDVAP